MSRSHTAAAKRVHLVLHIGTEKTGTSSIQAFLHTNRHRLAELGFLYPRTPGAGRHTRISLSVLPDQALERAPAWRRQGYTSAAQFREQVHSRLLAEFANAALPSAILSDEALYGARDVAFDRLRRFTDENARSLRVVVYLRRQDDHLASRYQQMVKTGETRRLVERVQNPDLSRFYDYRTRLRRWEERMQPAWLVVRAFDPACFAGGSLHQDFLDSAGVAARAEDLEAVTDRNESLDAEAVELLRILNLYRMPDDGTKLRGIDNRDLVKRLRAAVAAEPGPVLTLPAAVLDEFMARWEESNRAVARDFLDDGSGRLFRTPRRTDNITTVQVFDPARLDRFLDVLELPEEDHAPLRALVEREAATP